jgi:hypothetical protein
VGASCFPTTCNGLTTRTERAGQTRCDGGLASSLNLGEAIQIPESAARTASDAAALLMQLSLDDQVVVFRVLPGKNAAAVFEYLSQGAKEWLLEGMAHEEVVAFSAVDQRRNNPLSLFLISSSALFFNARPARAATSARTIGACAEPVTLTGSVTRP